MDGAGPRKRQQMRRKILRYAAGCLIPPLGGFKESVGQFTMNVPQVLFVIPELNFRFQEPPDKMYFAVDQAGQERRRIW